METHVLDMKLSVQGYNGVGKTAICTRFVEGNFQEEYYTQGFYNKTIRLPDIHGNISSDNPCHLLDIMDTEGVEEFSLARQQMLVHQEGFIVVYSITSRESVDYAKKVLREIYQVKEKTDVPVILVANKCDLEERVVSTSEGIEIAMENNIPYIETSAKTGINIDCIFTDLAKKCYTPTKVEPPVPISPTQKQKKKNSFIGKAPPLTEEERHTNILFKVPPQRLYHYNTEYTLEPPTISSVRTYLLFSELQKSMQQLLKEKVSTDVSFKVTDSDTLILAHKFVMVHRCSAMPIILGETSKEVKIPYKAATFGLFLDYIYTDDLTIPTSDLDAELPPLLDLATAWNVLNLVSLLAKKFPTRVPMATAVFESHLKDDLLSSLEESELNMEIFDVKFKIADYGEFIHAHKAMLMHRSPYFRAMFTSGTKETNEYQVEVKDIDYATFQSVLEFCYVNEVTFDDLLNPEDLLQAANVFCLDKLKLIASEHVARDLQWQTLIQVYKLAQLVEAPDLCNICAFYICRTFDALSRTKDFALLTKEEKQTFIDKRKDWPLISDLEIFWMNQLGAEEGDQEREPTTKCVVM